MVTEQDLIDQARKQLPEANGYPNPEIAVPIVPEERILPAATDGRPNFKGHYTVYFERVRVMSYEWKFKSLV